MHVQPSLSAYPGHSTQEIMGVKFTGLVTFAAEVPNEKDPRSSAAPSLAMFGDVVGALSSGDVKSVMVEKSHPIASGSVLPLVVQQVSGRSVDRA